MTGRRWALAALWLPGLLVAAGAAVATAHGLFEVATAAGVPTAIAAVYPVITDGLALVAYAATARLRPGAGRGYAWTIVVLAAGLSGLAQAAYLADGVHTAPGWLRFGVGAWPAIAAAIVAHLLYLLGTHRTGDTPGDVSTGDKTPADAFDAAGPDPGPLPNAQTAPAVPVERPTPAPDPVPAAVSTSVSARTGQPRLQAEDDPLTAAVWPPRRPIRGPHLTAAHLNPCPPIDPPPVQPAVQPPARPPVQTTPDPVRVQRPSDPVPREPYDVPVPLDTPTPAPEHAPAGPPPVTPNGSTGAPAPARQRAQDAARAHRERHGRLPTVTELMGLTDVARGTAHTALKSLRTDHPGGQPGPGDHAQETRR